MTTPCPNMRRLVIDVIFCHYSYIHITVFKEHEHRLHNKYKQKHVNDGCGLSKKIIITDNNTLEKINR